jgi:hypothetical protein
VFNVFFKEQEGPGCGVILKGKKKLQSLKVKEEKIRNKLEGGKREENYRAVRAVSQDCKAGIEAGLALRSKRENSLTNLSLHC